MRLILPVQMTQKDKKPSARDTYVHAEDNMYDDKNEDSIDMTGNAYFRNN